MNTNVRADMLRQAGIHPNSSMLGHNPNFMQNPPQPGQQPLPQGHMGLPPGTANANNPMGMLPNNPQNASRFLPMQQPGSIQPPQQQPGRMPMIRQPPAGQHMGSQAGPQLASLGPNQLFHANMAQTGPNLGQRRPQPQPHATAGHIAGLPQPNINLAMNPQNTMQGLRPGQQQTPQRMQLPLNGVPDMALMARQGSNGSGLSQNMTRTSSAMGALNPPSQVNFPSGMQPSHPQANLQNQVQMSNQMPISSPRPGSHPQAHNPNVNMAAAGPSQTPVNRTRMTPENTTMFGIGFPNSQFPQGPSANRLPDNAQFPFTSSNSPIQIQDSMSGSIINAASGTPTRATFQLTPAQQLEQMNTQPDSFNPPFNMQPPRPPSQHNLHPSAPQQQPPFQPPMHQQSPRPSDPHVSHPQRPASQPQQLIPGRPPSRPGPHTPSQINVNAGNRIPIAPVGSQPPHAAIGSGPPSVPPRPPQQPMPPPGGPTGPPSLQSADGPATNAMSMVSSQSHHVGSGQGLQRLLQFSGILANESQSKLHLSWWDGCVKEYFTTSAIMKITLWKDNQRAEAKPFEIGVPILPRFFLVTTQSGVRSMTLALDGARERIYPGNQHHCIIECPSAVWTYKYNNGYAVTLRGPLTAHIVVSPPTLSTSDSAFQGGQRHLKFENLQFDADQHDKYVLLDTVMHSRVSGSPHVRNDSVPTINGIAIQPQLEDERKWEEPRIMIERSLIPGEPVNAFGIPQATMRCLELAESVGQMSDLIVYSTENRLGPIEALKKYAAQIRESQYGPFNSVLSTGNTTSNPPSTYTFVTSTPNGPSAISQGGTLYSSAPPSVTNPQVTSTTSISNINSPQNTTSSASNSPQKQHKTIPQQQQQSQGSSSSSTAPAASPTVSSGATTNTPHMANSNLKRKQNDVASPTISNTDQPPAKRPQRKRGRTGGG